ncbi:MAG: hypothetical protein MJ252_05580 [archaeon]|nr:hypothetical protein [archaeon]
MKMRHFNENNNIIKKNTIYYPNYETPKFNSIDTNSKENNNSHGLNYISKSNPRLIQTSLEGENQSEYSSNQYNKNNYSTFNRNNRNPSSRTDIVTNYCSPERSSENIIKVKPKSSSKVENNINSYNYKYNLGRTENLSNNPSFLRHYSLNPQNPNPNIPKTKSMNVFQKYMGDINNSNNRQEDMNYTNYTNYTNNRYMKGKNSENKTQNIRKNMADAMNYTNNRHQNKNSYDEYAEEQNEENNLENELKFSEVSLNVYNNKRKNLNENRSLNTNYSYNKNKTMNYQRQNNSANTTCGNTNSNSRIKVNKSSDYLKRKKSPICDKSPVYFEDLNEVNDDNFNKEKEEYLFENKRINNYNPIKGNIHVMKHSHSKIEQNNINNEEIPKDYRIEMTVNNERKYKDILNEMIEITNQNIGTNNIYNSTANERNITEIYKSTLRKMKIRNEFINKLIKLYRSKNQDGIESSASISNSGNIIVQLWNWVRFLSNTSINFYKSGSKNQMATLNENTNRNEMNNQNKYYSERVQNNYRNNLSKDNSESNIKNKNEPNQYEEYCKGIMKEFELENFEDFKTFIEKTLKRRANNDNFLEGIKKILLTENKLY